MRVGGGEENAPAMKKKAASEKRDRTHASASEVITSTNVNCAHTHTHTHRGQKRRAEEGNKVRMRATQTKGRKEERRDAGSICHTPCQGGCAGCWQRWSLCLAPTAAREQ